jgi:hypothetical protein
VSWESAKRPSQVSRDWQGPADIRPGAEGHGVQMRARLRHSYTVLFILLSIHPSPKILFMEKTFPTMPATPEHCQPGRTGLFAICFFKEQ